MELLELLELLEIIDNKKELIEKLSASSMKNNLALVPTMGALHAGHIKLFEEARKRGPCVVSIFINPFQFNSSTDYEKYPINLENDLELCKQSCVDLVFKPRLEEIAKIEPLLKLSMPALSANLCGLSRPGHFEGVLFIVLRLLLLFKPEFILLGKKDYQQYIIIRHLVRDLDLSVKVVGINTVRESDGLACSSRNVRLKANYRKDAALIYRALNKAKLAYLNGENSSLKLKKLVRDIIYESSSNRIDYLEIVECEGLKALTSLSKQKHKFIFAVSVFCDEVRLIDNLECEARI